VLPPHATADAMAAAMVIRMGRCIMLTPVDKTLHLVDEQLWHVVNDGIVLRYAPRDAEHNP
jgi:hypothetical protein